MTNMISRITSGETLLANSVRAVLALTLAAPLVVTAAPWPETVYPFVVGKALWTRSLIEVAFGLWIILIVRNPAYRPPKYWLLGLFAGYLFLALLAGVFGVSLTRSLWSTYERMGGWLALAHWFVFLLMLVSMLRTWEHWRALLNFNTGVGVLVGLLALSEYFGWGWFPYLTPKNRIASTLGNPTYLGGYAAVNAFIAGALLADSFARRRRSSPDEAPPTARREPRSAEGRRRRGRGTASFPAWHAPLFLWRLFWLTAIALNLAGLWMSDTRGALAGLTAGLIALGVAGFCWAPSRRWRIATGTATAAAMLFVVVVVAAALLPQEAGPLSQGEERTQRAFWKRLSFGLDQRNVEYRISANLVGFKGFLDRPVLGWGPENFIVAYDRHVPAELGARRDTTFDQAHNKVIEELATKGLLGSLAYLAIWLYLLSVLIRKGRFLAPEQRRFAGLMGAGLVCYFTQNLFLFDTPGTTPQLLALMAFVVFVDSRLLRLNRDSPDVMRFRMLRRPLAAVSRFTGGENVQDIPAARLRCRLERIGQRAGAAARLIGLNGPVGIVYVVLLVGCAVFFLNVRVVFASHSALLTTTKPNLSWAEASHSLERSTSSFPPLANELRLIAFSGIINSWGDRLEPGQPGFGKNRAAVQSIVEEHGVKAIATEPENYRFYLAIANVNHRLASGDPDRLALAREQINRAAELAPNRYATQQALAVQLLRESNPEEGLRVIDHYVAEAPEARPRLARLRTRLEDEVKTRAIADYLNRLNYPAKPVGDGKPAIRSDFDVYLAENHLIYVKMQCGDADVAPKFFLHLDPVDVNDLPGHRKQNGYANLDFSFDRHGEIVGGICLTAVPLPEYAITEIRTGQFVRRQGRIEDVWEGKIAVDQ